MSEMIVQVRNKMLRRIGGVNHFVSHNKDYTIQFQFDESWNNVRTKMAVFAYEDGEYGSEIFDGDTCNVPELPREGRILIGVKAGEDLSTELLCIPVCKSADDVITDEYDEPDPKIYEQILDIINNLWNGGTTVYPSPVRFLAAPSTAKVGDLIRVKEVDENGEIKETEAVDVEKELVVVNITEDTDGVLHVDMTYDEINPLRYTHAVYAKWASGMYPYSTSARMYFGEDLKNVFVFSSSMAGMENWRIAIAQDGSVKINSYKLELVGRKVQTIDETTGTGDDSEKNYPSAKAVYDAIGQKIDKNQGTKNAGKILGIGADGNVTPQNKPAQALAGAAAPTTATAGVVGQEYYVIVNNAVTEMYVCTAVANGTYTWDKVEFGGGNTTGVSLGITGASVGQIAKITAVDSAGKPTAWEPVNMPSGGGGGGVGGHWETVLDTVWEQDVINPTAFDSETGIFTCAEGELNNLELNKEYIFFQQCTKEGAAYNTILGNEIQTVTKLSDTTFSIDATPPATFVPTNVKFSKGAFLAITDIDAKKIRLTLDGQFCPTATSYTKPFCGTTTPYFGRNTGYVQIRSAYQAYQQVTAEVESPYRIVGEILCGFNAPSQNGSFHFKNNSFCCPLVPYDVPEGFERTYLLTSDGTKIAKLYSTNVPWTNNANQLAGNDLLKIISGTKVKLERWVE